jgi:hypothetical protein
MGKDNAEQIIDLMSTICSEKNSTIDKFATFGLKASNAFESQALLQLKNEYCTNKRCLQCALGLDFLKQ